MITVIPLAECVEGDIYILRSRNLVLGVFDGKTGFIGIREKFGHRYLFTEYHHDTGTPHGTASPVRAVSYTRIRPLKEYVTAESTDEERHAHKRLKAWLATLETRHALAIDEAHGITPEDRAEMDARRRERAKRGF